MTTTPTIRKLQAHERDGAFPLLHDLYGEVDETTFRHRLQQMEAENGYELHGAFVADLLVGVGGIIRLTNLIYGGYFWLHDLVIARDHRGCGVGTRMMAYFADLASHEGRGYVALAAHHLDAEAIRFYEKHLCYERRGIVFRSLVGASS